MAGLAWIAHVPRVLHDVVVECRRNRSYSIVAMSLGTVELEPEVRDRLQELSTAQFATAAFYIDLLAEEGPLLGEPYTRQLDGKLRELRFHLGRQACGSLTGSHLVVGSSCSRCSSSRGCGRRAR